MSLWCVRGRSHCCCGECSHGPLSAAEADTNCPIMARFFLTLLLVPTVSEWEAQGLLLVLLSFVRQIYTVFFLIFTETTSIFWLNRQHCWMTKVTDTYFYDSTVAFSNASIHCKAVLYTPCWDNSLINMWSS